MRPPVKDQVLAGQRLLDPADYVRGRGPEPGCCPSARGCRRGHRSSSAGGRGGRHRPAGHHGAPGDPAAPQPGRALLTRPCGARTSGGQTPPCRPGAVLPPLRSSAFGPLRPVWVSPVWLGSVSGQLRASSRSRRSPRDVADLTVPSGQPSAAAVSASVRCSQYRSTRTARCRGGSWSSMRTSASRRSTPAVASAGARVPPGAGGVCAAAGPGAGNRRWPGCRACGAGPPRGRPRACASAAATAPARSAAGPGRSRGCPVSRTAVRISGSARSMRKLIQFPDRPVICHRLSSLRLPSTKEPTPTFHPVPESPAGRPGIAARRWPRPSAGQGFCVRADVR